MCFSLNFTIHRIADIVDHHCFKLPLISLDLPLCIRYKKNYREMCSH